MREGRSSNRRSDKASEDKTSTVDKSKKKDKKDKKDKKEKKDKKDKKEKKEKDKRDKQSRRRRESESNNEVVSRGTVSTPHDRRAVNKREAENRELIERLLLKVDQMVTRDEFDKVNNDIPRVLAEVGIFKEKLRIYEDQFNYDTETEIHQ